MEWISSCRGHDTQERHKFLTRLGNPLLDICNMCAGVMSHLRLLMFASQVFKQHWVVLDGPIDVGWIESMNTALDDNSTLCLASGERIKLPFESMRLLFEVENLCQASPATVR